jgi:hypothetical protein
MKQDQIGFEVLGEIRCAFCTAKEVDPYRSVDQDHCAPSRIGSRRRDATSTSGTFPRSAANRRRAASSTSAFRPSRTATDLVGAPVTRTASSRRSRSISIVVLMHRASHETYAGSTATKASPQGVWRASSASSTPPRLPRPAPRVNAATKAARMRSWQPSSAPFGKRPKDCAAATATRPFPSAAFRRPYPSWLDRVNAEGL